MTRSSQSEPPAVTGDRGCTCAIGGPFRDVCPIHYDDDNRNYPSDAAILGLPDDCTIDVSTCPGPDGTAIPLLHFDDEIGPGKLAVSFAKGRAVIGTSNDPSPMGMLRQAVIMLSPTDRKVLGQMLLRDDL